MLLAERRPRECICAYSESPYTCASYAVAQSEVTLLEVGEFKAACLGCEEHRKGRVLGVLDLGDGIHEDGQAARCFHGGAW